MLTGRSYASRFVVCGILLLSFVLAGCAGDSGGDPKKVVISMFGAMEKNDKAALAHLLDLPTLMQNTEDDYALSGDSARVFTNPQDILDDMTGNGVTKQRWFSMQRIIGETQIMDDQATVEVTFVDKANSKGYRAKFGLHRQNGKWRIYSFQTLSDNM